MEDEKRCFLALPVGDEVKVALQKKVDALRDGNPKVRWVAPDGYHFTLFFFGKIKLSKINKIIKLINNSLHKMSPFDLSISGCGFFPGEYNPRIFWLGVDSGRDNISSIYNLVKLDIKAIVKGLKINRDYIPHLTLARIKGNIHRNEIETIKATFLDIDIKDRIDRLVLFESTLTPRGSIYTPIEEFVLY